MASVTIDFPKFMDFLFPEYPHFFGPFCFFRPTQADQLRADAAIAAKLIMLLDRLAYAEAMAAEAIA